MPHVPVQKIAQCFLYIMKDWHYSNNLVVKKNRFGCNSNGYFSSNSKVNVEVSCYSKINFGLKTYEKLGQSFVT